MSGVMSLGLFLKLIFFPIQGYGNTEDLYRGKYGKDCCYFGHSLDGIFYFKMGFGSCNEFVGMGICWLGFSCLRGNCNKSVTR